VVSPFTYSINADALTMDLGKLASLENLSHFSWVNASTLRGTLEHYSDHGVFSYFEYGKASSQVAKFGPMRGNGKRYKLRPYADHEGYWLSTKRYPAFRMYSDFNVAKWEDAVAEIIRSVKF
jgi:hypothetical protein